MEPNYILVAVLGRRLHINNYEKKLAYCRTVLNGSLAVLRGETMMEKYFDTYTYTSKYCCCCVARLHRSIKHYVPLGEYMYPFIGVRQVANHTWVWEDGSPWLYCDSPPVTTKDPVPGKECVRYNPAKDFLHASCIQDTATFLCGTHGLKLHCTMLSHAAKPLCPTVEKVLPKLSEMRYIFHSEVATYNDSFHACNNENRIMAHVTDEVGNVIPMLLDYQLSNVSRRRTILQSSCQI